MDCTWGGCLSSVLRELVDLTFSASPASLFIPFQGGCAVYSAVVGLSVRTRPLLWVICTWVTNGTFRNLLWVILSHSESLLSSHLTSESPTEFPSHFWVINWDVISVLSHQLRYHLSSYQYWAMISVLSHPTELASHFLPILSMMSLF